MFILEKTAYIMKETLTDERVSGVHSSVAGKAQHNRQEPKKRLTKFSKKFEKGENVTGRVTTKWYNLTVTW